MAVNIMQDKQTLRLGRLAFMIATHFSLLGILTFDAQAREFFNPALLELDSQDYKKTDLSLFEEGDTQAPGTYRVDISLNGNGVETRDVEFRMGKNAQGQDSLQPCLTVAELNTMGVKTDLFPALGTGDAHCVDLNSIPNATAEFLFSSQQLLLSVPQASVVQQTRGEVPESQWDNGIPALLLNYSISGASNYPRNGDNGSSHNQFANFRPGVNIGPWRLRNYTTWSRNNQGDSEWNSVYVYAQRNLVSLKSQMVLGDSNSPNDVFDSVPFRGGQISSDDEMIPDSLKGYAPIVRGIARTNAQVLIRQNGYVIYQTFVSPGAFEITDMYPSGGSGNLFVTIKESDGSEQRLVIPYASLPVLQREGRIKYAVTGGQYRTYDDNVEKSPFSQVSVIYGLPYGLTAYGGGQLSSNKYRSLALGMGKNLGDFGALSTDVTQSWATLRDQNEENGQSWRIRYSKNFVQTGTDFTVAGYRYSTDGYYSLQETLDTYTRTTNERYLERRRNRSEVMMNQRLWEGAGSVSLSLIHEDYWNSDRTMRSIGAGYNNSWNGVSYGLNYSYNENSNINGNAGRLYQRDQIFSFNISIPLQRWMRGSYASYSLNTSQNGGSTHSAGVGGSALADNNLSWGVQQGYGSRGVGNSGSLNLAYLGGYGQTNAGYSYDNNSQRLNYGVQGGVVVHENGITLGQTLGETIALVKAPGANGIGVQSGTGIKTDWRGYAIVPNSSPYHKNQVQLDSETLADNVELITTSKNVVPTRGAVVRADFDISIGQRVLMTLHKQVGGTVPFGALVSDTRQQQAQAAIVGDNGQVYLTGLSEQGTLKVKWGSDAMQQCQVNYRLLPAKKENAGIQTLDAQCF